MSWTGWSFVTDIKEGERGFLYRDGAFQRLLGPGRHRFFDIGRHFTCTTSKVARAEVPAEIALLFRRQHPEVATENFEIVQCGPHEVAIVDFDGQSTNFVLPNTTRAFWKIITDVGVEKIDAGAQVCVSKSVISTGWSARLPRSWSSVWSKPTRPAC